MSKLQRQTEQLQSILELDIWSNRADRHKMVSGLSEKGLCEKMEFVFRRKDRIQITGMLSAKVITLQGESHIISVTRDITAHKQAEALAHNIRGAAASISAGARLAVTPESSQYFRGSLTVKVLPSPISCLAGTAAVPVGSLRRKASARPERYRSSVKV